ncbi:MAG: tandem-95 repeat protein, partial [Sulfuricella denitrificans]|nr:tandem-95 repeat protein [Sulfuricella denitrificans]
TPEPDLNAILLAPPEAGSVQAELRRVTRDMLRASGGMFLSAGGALTGIAVSASVQAGDHPVQDSSTGQTQNTANPPVQPQSAVMPLWRNIEPRLPATLDQGQGIASDERRAESSGDRSESTPPDRVANTASTASANGSLSPGPALVGESGEGGAPAAGAVPGTRGGMQTSAQSSEVPAAPRILVRNDIYASADTHADRPGTDAPSMPEITTGGDNVTPSPATGETPGDEGTPTPNHATPVASALVASAQPQAVYVYTPAPPRVTDENADGEEDQPILIDPALLLENDLPGETGRTLRLAAVGDARHGTVEIDADGNILFTPEENYAGEASFQYSVEDSGGLQTPGRFTLNLANSNDAPEARDEETDSDEDIVLHINTADLLANDSDPDLPYGDTLTLTAVGNARHGTVEIGADGNLIFTPEADYYGDAGFDYTVSDSQGETAHASAIIHLASVEDAPRVQGETLACDEDQTLQFTAAGLLANDSAGEPGRSIHLAGITNASHGTVELDAQGEVIFTPDANYFGAAGFDYVVEDDHGMQSTASVSLDLASVNDTPIASGEELASDEDVALVFNPADLLANEVDADLVTGDLLAITHVGNASHGTARIEPDGQIRFTPEPDYFGEAGFEYTVSDSGGASTTANVQIHLAPVNDAPHGDISTAGREDQGLVIDPADLLAHASDAEGDAITLSDIGNPSHGQLDIGADGQIRFTPDENYHGEAGFSYTLTDAHGAQAIATAHIDFASVNDLPQAVGESVGALEDEILNFSRLSLLANDTDVETAPEDLRIASVGNARHGTVQLTADGGVRFTPQADYFGEAGFDYTVEDADGGLATAGVSIALEAVNDAPRLQGESMSILENTTRIFSSAVLLANDTDPDNVHADLAIVGVGGASHGQVSLGTDGAVTFTPDFNFTGYGGFTYTVSDGVGGVSQAVTLISVVPPNQSPVVNGEIIDTKRAASITCTTAQLLANDWDPDGDGLTISNVDGAYNGSVYMSGGAIVFTPVGGTGSLNAGFSYTVSDGHGAYGTGQVALNLAMNRTPVAVDDGFTGYEDIALTISQSELLANDSDPDNPHGDLRIVNVGGAINLASLSLQGGSVVARPAPEFSGTASFNYEVSDGEGGSTVATAILTILPVNDAPIVDQVQYNASMISYVDSETGGYISTQNPNQTGHIFAHDPDGNSAALRYEIASQSAHGHENSLNAAGDWRYESQQGDPYNGPDSFTVKVIDAEGAFTLATINTLHVGSGGGSGKPVTLDLDGNGLQFANLDDSQAYFDINGDGWREHIAWVAGGDALLVLDTEGDRVIDKPEEISFVGYAPDAQTDLEGLSAFDSNGDGRLDRLDARWGDFGAWLDGNGNGVTDAGEFQTLEEAGIADIGLESNHQVQRLGDVTLLGVAEFTRTDGSTGAVGDVTFRYESGDIAKASPATSSTEIPLVEEEDRHGAVRVVDAGLAASDETVMDPVPELAVSAETNADDATDSETILIADADVARLGLLFTQLTASVDLGTEPPMGMVEVQPANDAVFPTAGAFEDNNPLPLVVGA